MTNALHNPLGVFNAVFGHLPLHEAAAEMRALGLTHVHLEPGAALQSETLDSASAKRIRRTLADQGIEAAAIAGYTNLVDPDRERRETRLRRLERLIELSHDLGSPYVATETGSVNPVSEWDDDPDNHTPSIRDEMLEVLDRLLRKAREHGVTLLIEGYVNNVVATTEEAVELRRRFGTDRLGYVLDPFNYFRQGETAPERQRQVLERVFEAVVPHAPVAHAKDVIYLPDGTIDTPKVGGGVLDWKLYAALLRRHAPDVPLILEHLSYQDVPGCIAKVKQAFAEAQSADGEEEGDRHGQG